MSLSDTAAALDGKAELTAEDALAVRKALYGAGLAVSQADADTLFKLNADAGRHAPEWRALYIEALTDFVVRQQTPPGYVDQARADWLTAALTARKRLREDEVDLLIHVVDQADQTPASLSAFVLATVRTLTLWRLQRQGRLDAVDVERLRRVVFAKGGDTNAAVTRAEAEALFDINDALDGAPAEGWTDFFVRAVANAVLFEATWQADRAEELRRETWLHDTGAHPLHRLAVLRDLPALPHLMKDALDEIHDLDFETQDEAVLEQRFQADEGVEVKAQAVTADEAHWLLDRIGRNGGVDTNEQALVAFILANGRAAPPELQALTAALRAHRPDAAA